MKKSLFDKLVKQSSKVEAKDFIVFANPDKETFKTGFVINKTIGNSVKRNKIKRIFRNLIRRNFKSGDFLVIVKNSPLLLSKEAFEDEWEKIERKISLLQH